MIKKISWNLEKNKKLKLERKISFEIIKECLSKGDLLEVIPNKKHANQKIFIVHTKTYIYCVPFIENEKEIFLKTIYPSRKYLKKYLTGVKK
jgi:hypothetical protein